MRVVLCFILSCIFVYVKTAKQQRAVNVALETVIEFDNKSNDLKLINKVQRFLNRVKNVLGSEKISRRHLEVYEMKLTDFLQNVGIILKSYEDADLEQVFDVIDAEIRKFHYEGCKVPELLENTHMRRYMANKLEEMKEIPAHKIRRGLHNVLKILQEKKFDTQDLELIHFINSLYGIDDAQKLLNVINNLEVYKSKSKRSEADLKNIIKHGIRNVFFDHYSNLNTNLRRELKLKIESFWHNLSNPDVKRDHKIFNIFKKNTPISTEKAKISNIEIPYSPDRELELKDTINLNELSSEDTTKKKYDSKHHVSPVNSHKSKIKLKSKHDLIRVKPIFETNKEFFIRDKHSKKKHHSKSKKYFQKHKSKTVKSMKFTKQPNIRTIYEEVFAKHKKKHVKETYANTRQPEIYTVFKENWTNHRNKQDRFGQQRTEHLQTIFEEEYTGSPKKKQVTKKAKVRKSKKRPAITEPVTKPNKETAVELSEKTVVTRIERKRKPKIAVKKPVRSRTSRKSKIQTVWVEELFTHKANLRHEDNIIEENRASENVEEIKTPNKNMHAQDVHDTKGNVLNEYTEAFSGNRINKEEDIKSKEEVTQKMTTKSRKFLPLVLSNEGLTIESFESFIHRKSNANDTFLLSRAIETNNKTVETTATKEPAMKQIDEIEKHLTDLRSELIVRNITGRVQNTPTEVLPTGVAIDQEAEALASIEAKKFEELDFWEGITRFATITKNFQKKFMFSTGTILTTSEKASNTTSTTIETSTSITSDTTTPTASTTADSEANNSIPVFRTGKDEADDNAYTTTSSNQHLKDINNVTEAQRLRKLQFPPKNKTNGKVTKINEDADKNIYLQITNKPLNTTKNVPEEIKLTSTTIKLDTDKDNFFNISDTINEEDLVKDKNISEAVKRGNGMRNFYGDYSLGKDASYVDIGAILQNDNLKRSR